MTDDEWPDDYAHDDDSLLEALDDDLREDISRLAQARGQTSGGVVASAVKQLRDDYEGRIIEFPDRQHARSYYKRHRLQALELKGALDEVTPDPYGEHPAECVNTVLSRQNAMHCEKWRAAARWLDANDPDTRVIVNDHGVPEEIPQLDSGIETTHGTADSEDEEVVAR